MNISPIFPHFELINADAPDAKSELHAVWADGTFCLFEDLEEMTHMSDDFELRVPLEYASDGTPLFDIGAVTAELERCAAQCAELAAVEAYLDSQACYVYRDRLKADLEYDRLTNILTTL